MRDTAPQQQQQQQSPSSSSSVPPSSSSNNSQQRQSPRPTTTTSSSAPAAPSSSSSGGLTPQLFTQALLQAMASSRMGPSASSGVRGNSCNNDPSNEDVNSCDNSLIVSCLKCENWVSTTTASVCELCKLPMAMFKPLSISFLPDLLMTDGYRAKLVS